jgi:hypothetical protein
MRVDTPFTPGVDIWLVPFASEEVSVVVLSNGMGRVSVTVLVVTVGVDPFGVT